MHKACWLIICRDCVILCLIPKVNYIIICRPTRVLLKLFAPFIIFFTGHSALPTHNPKPPTTSLWEGPAFQHLTTAQQEAKTRYE